MCNVRDGSGLLDCGRWCIRHLDWLSVGDEGGVAGRAGPRRQAVGLAAGKMRPMIGDDAGEWTARPEYQPKTDGKRRNQSFGDHIGCRLLLCPDRKLQNTPADFTPKARKWSRRPSRMRAHLKAEKGAFNPLNPKLR